MHLKVHFSTLSRISSIIIFALPGTVQLFFLTFSSIFWQRCVGIFLVTYRIQSSNFEEYNVSQLIGFKNLLDMSLQFCILFTSLDDSVSNFSLPIRYVKFQKAYLSTYIFNFVLYSSVTLQNSEGSQEPQSCPRLSHRMRVILAQTKYRNIRNSCVICNTYDRL